jgi:hypothetical protein
MFAFFCLVNGISRQSRLMNETQNFFQRPSKQFCRFFFQYYKQETDDNWNPTTQMPLNR